MLDDLTPDEQAAIDEIRAKLVGLSEDEQASVLASVFARAGFVPTLPDAEYEHITGQPTVPLLPDDDSAVSPN